MSLLEHEILIKYMCPDNWKLHPLNFTTSFSPIILTLDENVSQVSNLASYVLNTLEFIRAESRSLFKTPVLVEACDKVTPQKKLPM